MDEFLQNIDKYDKNKVRDFIKKNNKDKKFIKQ